MSSPASIAGHPIHPMLVAIPIGLWIFSLVSDIIRAASLGGPVWSDIAFVTMAGGLVGALLAALPGLVDFAYLHDARTKRIGQYHMVINLTVVALYAVNLWLRSRPGQGLEVPMALSVVAVVGLAVSGWLGGELVFRHGVSVAPQHDSPEQEQAKIRRAA